MNIYLVGVLSIELTGILINLPGNVIIESCDYLPFHIFDSILNLCPGVSALDTNLIISHLSMDDFGVNPAMLSRTIRLALKNGSHLV